MSVLIGADTFTDSNGAALGTTNGAGVRDPHTWTVQSGTWEIQSNQARTSVTGGGSPVASVATIDAELSDLDISYTHVVTDTNGQSLIFRYTDINNFLMVRGDNTQCHLLKAVAGSSSTISTIEHGTSTLGTLGTNTVVRVTCHGATIKVYLDGVLVGTATEAFNKDATVVGMGAQGTAQRFDNFSVSAFDTGAGSFLVEMAFGEQPLEDPTITWTDVTPDVRTVDIRRGRDGAQDDFQPGTCAIVLNNETGQYDPQNNTDIVPRVPVRVSAVDSTATRQWLFTGFVNRDNGWAITYPTPHWSFVNVSCADYLAILSQTRTLDTSTEIRTFITARGSNVLGPFVRRVSSSLLDEPEPVSIGPGFAGDILTLLFLSYVTYPQWANAISGTASTVILDSIELGADGLSFVQKMALSEGGAIYVLGDGGLNFDGRHAITEDSRLASAQFTLDDTGSAGPSFLIADYQRAPTTPVYNQSVVTPVNAPAQAYEDATSITAYGPSRQDMPGLLMESSAEARARAEFFVKSNNVPVDAPKSVKLKPRRDDDTLDLVLQAELRDGATVKFTAPGLTQKTYACALESIEHRIDCTNKDWDCVLGFSSRDRFDEFTADGIFTLNTDVLNTGLLGY